MKMQSPGVDARAALRRLRGSLALCTVLVLAACGGDSECPASPPFEGSGNVGSCADGGSTTPTAADLTLVLSANSLPNDGTSTIKATATAVDANRNALAGIPITVRVDGSAVATVSGTETDAKGVVTADIGSGADQANRSVTVTAVSGGLTRTATFQVVGANLNGTPLPAVIAPGAAGQVDFQLKDVNANPMSGQTIVVNGVDGVEVTGTTDSNGKYTYAYTAPATTGTVSIKATAGGASSTQSVLVQASGVGAIPPAAVAVQSASLAASPSVVPVNSGSTSNQSELRALFLGAGNTPVKNVRVRFDLAGDVNNVGGTVTSGSTVVYSDANGVATTAYVPGTRFSPTNGLTVRACWSETDFAAGTCPKSAVATLTVVSESLSVSIGTNALIEIGPTGLDYIKKYLVQVNDSSGNAKGGVQVSASIDLQQYQKGEWVVVGDKWAKTLRASCDNEDLNRNGVLQVFSNGAVEDANATGFLEPRKADVAISFVGSSTTNSDGQVVLKITYPQNVGSWLKFNIQVAASGVAGTEGRSNFSGILPVLADDVSDPDKEPPFRLSPYGTEASPTVATTTPEGQTGLLCTNPN
ncbi:MAG: hypothetical protein J0L57_03645 [Burkholderiales bacterium]|nr:hypothetical protein [Dechloromonas sp.]MBN8507684.1 hypothetical protein [Burkholderiales bacterium]